MSSYVSVFLYEYLLGGCIMPIISEVIYYISSNFSLVRFSDIAPTQEQTNDVNDMNDINETANLEIENNSIITTSKVSNNSGGLKSILRKLLARFLPISDSKIILFSNRDESNTDQNERALDEVSHYLTWLLTALAVQLTFGILFPPLAIVIMIAIVVKTTLWKTVNKGITNS